MRRFLLIGLAAMTIAAASGCGARVVEEAEDPIDPYHNFFVALGPQGTFLLPTLQQKLAFDRIRVSETPEGQPPTTLPADPNQPMRPTTQPWGGFVDRTGRRIFIAGDEELIERIRVAWEDREGTDLYPVDSEEAPPIAPPTPPPAEEAAD